ncbi:hypothetical protein [Brachybacterium kimchii]|uniref:Uncharacterized protein n=1 Tax=Brachybacterium kimchii TaxID=2942909 RepID=A0ABY4N5S8_9MICO|nr:hypothetical protein [Brachybacterium kimchii]UQN29461.1 hypothetical protein M4486_17780 [Brachybacterium kimchii]
MARKLRGRDTGVDPVDSIEDLRLLAANAGRYGVITVPAAAILDLIPEGAVSLDELGEAISDAEEAAGRASSAAYDAEAAADDLESLIDKLRKGARS